MSTTNNIAIVTTIIDDWGGSEELWAKSIPFFKEQGINQVTVYKNQVSFKHPEFVKLKGCDVVFKELDPAYPTIIKAAIKFKQLAGKLSGKLGLINYEPNRSAKKLYQYLKASPPNMVIISQAINFDGLNLAYQCFKLNIPYVLIMQKAVDFYWPNPSSRESMKAALLGAQKCFFVSQHNKTLTEEQFGMRLNNSEIVFNPVKTSTSGPLPYPSTVNGYRLACIGRLFVIDKGQDILLRILSQPQWREREVEVSFIGTGPDEDGIKAMADLLNVKNVVFKGYSDSMEAVWTNHHALILPSRSEGLPLVITEAMTLGRIAITTNAGGNAEIVKHQVTGFIGEANEKDLGDAMEQAWQQRDQWEQMGIRAAQYIKQHIPKLPERDFARLVKEVMNKQ